MCLLKVLTLQFNWSETRIAYLLSVRSFFFRYPLFCLVINNRLIHFEQTESIFFFWGARCKHWSMLLFGYFHFISKSFLFLLHFILTYQIGLLDLNTLPWIQQNTKWKIDVDFKWNFHFISFPSHIWVALLILLENTLNISILGHYWFV